MAGRLGLSVVGFGGVRCGVWWGSVHSRWVVGGSGVHSFLSSLHSHPMPDSPTLPLLLHPPTPRVAEVSVEARGRDKKISGLSTSPLQRGAACVRSPGRRPNLRVGCRCRLKKYERIKQMHALKKIEKQKRKFRSAQQRAQRERCRHASREGALPHRARRLSR